MTYLWGFVSHWALFLLICTAQVLIQLVLTAAYRAVRKGLDRRYPDVLPAGAGAWLRQELRRRSLDGSIQVIVTGSTGVGSRRCFTGERKRKSDGTATSARDKKVKNARERGLRT